METMAPVWIREPFLLAALDGIDPSGELMVAWDMASSYFPLENNARLNVREDAGVVKVRRPGNGWFDTAPESQTMEFHWHRKTGLKIVRRQAISERANTRNRWQLVNDQLHWKTVWSHFPRSTNR